MKGITQKQQNIMNAITAGYIRGKVPTVYELADEFKIKTSTVFAHLKALKKKGFITRSSEARSIRPNNLITLEGSRDQQLFASAVVVNRNHASLIEQAFRMIGCNEIVIHGVEQ